MSVWCEVLGVSRSGFYAYQRRYDVAHVDEAEIALLARVKVIAAASGYSYGSRRMAKHL